MIFERTRPSPPSWAMRALVVVCVGCAVEVRGSSVAAAPLERSCGVAVLPFEDRAGHKQAGAMVAALAASTLVLSDRYNIVEPHEVRALLRRDLEGHISS